MYSHLADYPVPAINRRFFSNRTWQRRFIAICWLVLALAVFIPAIYNCINTGVADTAHWDE